MFELNKSPCTKSGESPGDPGGAGASPGTNRGRGGGGSPPGMGREAPKRKTPQWGNQDICSWAICCAQHLCCVLYEDGLRVSAGSNLVNRLARCSSCRRCTSKPTVLHIHRRRGLLINIGPLTNVLAILRRLGLHRSRGLLNNGPAILRRLRRHHPKRPQSHHGF